MSGTLLVSWGRFPQPGSRIGRAIRVAGQGELRQRCRNCRTFPEKNAMPSKPLEPGDPVRLGRFELLGRLGEGGQGIVYLGRGTNPGEERVAVKVLRSTVDAYVMERLARELDAIHQVQPFVTAARPAARSRRTPILVACSAAAAALIVLAVVLLTRGSPPTSPAARAADTTPATQATSPPP